MTKKELAAEIAVALYPANYDFDSPAVQGEISSVMKNSKTELQSVFDHAKSFSVKD